MPTVVYLESDNPEGYIWESVEEAAVPLFIERGWYLSPADFPEKPEKVKKPSKPKVKKDLQDIVADL